MAYNCSNVVMRLTKVASISGGAAFIADRFPCLLMLYIGVASVKRITMCINSKTFRDENQVNFWGGGSLV